MTRLTSTVPASYDGREQAWIKHQLLEAYLKKLLRIIGAAARRTGKVEICYVDCFAGPWGDDSDNMDSTSIAISLRTMATCQEELSRLGVQATMRALFIELDDHAFGRLNDYLQRKTPAGVQSKCMHGDFLALREEILRWCGRTAFTFFFIDPKGWKTVGIANLRPLITRPRSEFLINFMYDFINRTASMRQWDEEIGAFLDESAQFVRNLEGLEPKAREHELLSTYRAGLKRVLPAHSAKYVPRTAYVRVLDKDKARPKYHLIYLTTHPRGIIEFMAISQDVELIQKRVRLAKKVDARQRDSRMEDMFSQVYEDLLDDDQIEPEVVDRFWLELLAGGEKMIDEAAFADILERNGWMPGDLQASLVRLISAGRVVNLDAVGKRPVKPLHYESNERLALRV